MPDTPSSPANPTPAPGGPPHHRPSVGLNKAQVAALAKAEKIATNAKNPLYLPLLTAPGDGPLDEEHQITAAKIDQLLADITACRTGVTAAQGETSQSHDATDDIDAAEHDLVAAMQVYQSRARQKHARKNPALLAAWHIGHRLVGNRANLEQFAEDFLTRSTTDPLPGITAADKTRLTDALAAWKGAIQRQATAGQAKRASVREQLESILERRLQIQFAADAIWPYHDPKNVEIRESFALTPHRPFDG